MKNIINFSKIMFAAVLILSACSPKEFDEYSLGQSGKITDDMITFEMTPAQGSDEWTFQYSLKGVDPVKIPFSFEIHFGDYIKDDEGNVLKEQTVSKQMTGTFEFVVLKGTCNVECIIFTREGNTIVKSKEIVVNNDNPKALMDDITSLQYALTGGKANIEGKEWKLGGWTSMYSTEDGARDVPFDQWIVWWDFKHPAIMDDIFTFKPNNVYPNGNFLHENNGDSFMNELLGHLFPDGNTGGSFVTESYTPKTDAKWKITERDGNKYLTINGFFGYATAPEELEETEYLVLSYSQTNIKLTLSSGWNGWCYELVAPSDPLTGIESKTWVIDGYNEVLSEVKNALDLNINGFMGLGPINSYGQEWWAATAGDKSFENVGWTLYDWTITFTADMRLIITTKGEGYGRKVFDGQGFNSTSTDGADMKFSYNGGDYTYTRDNSASPYPKLTLSGNAFLGYYCGKQEYEILYLSETAFVVAVHNTVEDHDWVFIYKPKND